MLKPLAAALCLALAACASAGPRADKVTIQKELVPVATPCSADPGPKPDFADSTAAIANAGDIFVLATLYAAGRQQHYEYEARLEAANEGCRQK